MNTTVIHPPRLVCSALVGDDFNGLGCCCRVACVSLMPIVAAPCHNLPNHRIDGFVASNICATARMLFKCAHCCVGVFVLEGILAETMEFIQSLALRNVAVRDLGRDGTLGVFVVLSAVEFLSRRTPRDCVNAIWGTSGDCEAKC